MMLSKRISTMAGCAGAVAAGLLAGFALLLPAVRAQAPAAGIAGVWMDHTGRGAVEIAPCGNSLCGRLAWLKEPIKKNGTPATDKKGRPLCGLQILGDLKQETSGRWGGGWIYDPEEDERFSAELTLKSPDTLQVLGFLGVKMLGETFTWKRAPAQQARCDTARQS